jgi:hypothetical protein
MTKSNTVISMALIACLLAACGGGGGGSSGGGATPPPSTGTATVSGRVTFDRPTYSGTALSFSSLERLPVRGATVEILRASDRSIVATATTGASDGRYSATVPAGSVIVRVKAQLRRAGPGAYDFEVRNNTSGNALYTLDSAAVNASGSVTVDLNAGTGFTVGQGYTGTRAAAPFAILDTIWRARELIHGVEPGLDMPALDIHWSTQNRLGSCNGRPNPATGEIDTSFYLAFDLSASGGCPAVPRGMYLLGDATTASADADEFDSSVVAHEFGHYFEDAFSRGDSVGGPHSLLDQLNIAVAFSEGWGNAFQGIVLGSPLYRDTFGTLASTGFSFSVESGSRSFVRGFATETSAQEFLWDVFDPANEPGSDAIDLGYGPIHAVMRDEMRLTDAVTSLFVMADALENRFPAQRNAIRARLSDDGITGTGPFGVGQPPVPADPDGGPLYRPVLFGQGSGMTSTNQFGDSDPAFASFNRLGGRRYYRVDLPSGGDLRVVAVGPVGSDPDFYLLRRGSDQCPNLGACSGLEDSVADGREEALFTGLAAGTYVLEVAECSNLGETCRAGPPRGNTSIDVTVTQP